MFVSLPMYDWPEIQAETDAFWRAVAKRLAVDLELDRSLAHDAGWTRPDLLLSQTCGYPFTHDFKGVMTYVATPHYAAEGCSGALYSSTIFIRAGKTVTDGDLRAAINSLDSMSGMLALKLTGPACASQLISGSHVRSLELVQAGAADICAIDAVCVALAQRHRPWLLDGLVRIAQSPLVPGLPLVTRAGDVAQLRKVIAGVVAEQSMRPVLDALLISDVSVLQPDAYNRILELEQSIA